MASHKNPTEVLTGMLFLGRGRPWGEDGVVRGLDPRTCRQLEPGYGVATQADVDAAAELADAALQPFGAATGHERGRLLDDIAAGLESMADVITAQVERETGIPEVRAQGELARTVRQLRIFGDIARDGHRMGERVDPADPGRVPVPKPEIRLRYLPLGPVAVFGASNFPLAFSVAGGDTAAALAAGCPVVVKAHSAHPGTSELVAKVISEAVTAAGLHEGVFSMLYGDASVGRALAVHPCIQAIAFTGSRAAGQALMRAAGARTVPIPVFAEMSSVNPVFLLPGAVKKNAATLARDYVASLTMGVGQMCTNPGLVFAVAGDSLDVFEESVSALIRDHVAGPMLTPPIRDSFVKSTDDIASLPGVRELASGSVENEVRIGAAARVFSSTTSTFLAERRLQDEAFGPSSVIVRADAVDDLIAAAESIEGQLTATVHAGPGDVEVATRLLSILERRAGRIVFDGWPTGVEVGPATVHGGPFPATSDSRSTSVGALAIGRFLRPVAYQNAPEALAPRVRR